MTRILLFYSMRVSNSINQVLNTGPDIEKYVGSFMSPTGCEPFQTMVVKELRSHCAVPQPGPLIFIPFHPKIHILTKCLDIHNWQN